MKAASPAAPPASEEAISTHMQTLCIQLGASNKYTDARLRATRRVHQPPMLLFAHMYAKCTWGGVGVPLLQQVLLQPGHFPVPQ